MSRKIIILSFLSFVLIFGLSGCQMIKGNSVSNNQTKRGIMKRDSAGSKTLREKAADPSQEALLNYEEILEIIPEDYHVIGSEWGYSKNPLFVLLKKNNGLFVYDVSQKKIDKFDNLMLEELDVYGVYPSISAGDKIFLNIARTKKLDEPNMFDYEVLETEQYILDVENKTFEQQKIDTKNDVYSLGGYMHSGLLFDSQFSRLLYWGVGPPCGAVLPINVYDLKTGISEEIVSVDEFVGGDSTCSVKIKHKGKNVLIYTTPDNTFSKEAMVVIVNEEIEKRYMKEDIAFFDVDINNEQLEYEICNERVKKDLDEIPLFTGKVTHSDNEERYTKKCQVVYYGNFRVQDIDYDSFQIIDDVYAKDSTHAFYQGIIIRPTTHEEPGDGGVDIVSFNVINENYSQDDYRVYYQDRVCRNDESKDLPGVEYRFSKGFVYEDEYYLDGFKLEGVDIDTFQILKNGYSKDQKNVYYQAKKLENADPGSFEVLEPENLFRLGVAALAKDQNHVYKREKLIIENVDFNTFQIINCLGAEFKDKNGLYDYQGEKINDIDKRIDYASLECIGTRYARDNNFLYYKKNIVEDFDINTFRIVEVDGRGLIMDGKNVYANGAPIEGVDPNTVEIIHWPYFKDKNNVYYNGDIVNQADSLTAEYVGDGYLVDKEKVFVRGSALEGVSSHGFQILVNNYFKNEQHVYHNNKVLDGADPYSFEILEKDYAKDKHNVFYRNKIITGVDAGSFELYVKKAVAQGGHYSRDKNNIYFNMKAIAGADGKTFEVSNTQPWFARDKNRIYKYGEIVDEYHEEAF